MDESIRRRNANHRDLNRRNSKIVQMRRDGISRGEVARRFQLSTSRIDLIEQMAEKDEKMARKNLRVLAKMRAADDLDQLWPVNDLIDLILPTAQTNALMRGYFSSIRKIKRMSLRELMDFTISDQADPRPGYLITPLFGVRCVGRWKFRAVVARLTALDLGRRCNSEWKRRRARLTRATRILGDHQYFHTSIPAHFDD